MRETIETLTKFPAMSGDEFELLSYLEERAIESGKVVRRDNLGTVLVSNGLENKPKLMIVANIDEFGFIIKKWIKNGVAELLPISNINVDLYIDRVCIVLDRYHNKYTGYITQLDGKLVCYIESNCIDVGDIVVVKQEVINLDEENILGSQLDNRACAAIACNLINVESNNVLSEIVFTPQSIVGSRASVTSVTTSNPDIAVILVCEQVTDYSPNSIYVRYFDKGMLPSRRLIEVITKYLKIDEIQVVPNFDDKINDSSLIHKSLNGVPSVVLVLPLKHKSEIAQILNLNDVETLKIAMETIMRSITKEDIEYIKFGGESIESRKQD